MMFHSPLDLAAYQYPFLMSPGITSTSRPAQKTVYILRAPQNSVVKHEPRDPDAASRSSSHDEQTTVAAGNHGAENAVNLSQVSSPSVVFQNRHMQVFEDASSYTLSIDMPGVKSSDAHVEILDGGRLKIQAERTKGEVAKVNQQFAFDEDAIDASQMKASLVDGVLTISMPKKEKVTPDSRDVPITLGYRQVVEGENAEAQPKTILTLDVPGVNPKDLKVQFNHGKLVISAERRRGETTVSKTHRSFPVNTRKIDVTRLEAFLADGVLEVVGPEKEAAAPVSVAISSSRENVPTLQNASEIKAETVADDEA